jgi:hypothetical protein
MGFRFRRSVRLLPGIRLNFSTRGVSTSVGGRGFNLNFGKRGIRTTVGIPGTGISYSEMLTRNQGAEPSATNATTPAAGSSIGCGTLVVIVFGVLGLARLIGGPADAGYSTPVPTESAVPLVLALPTATVTAKALKCRAAPNGQARVVRRLLRDTTVQRLNEQNGWVHISGETAASAPTESCWVAKRFLRNT